jgi:DNA-binding MarR family transcriptional regulator
MALKGNLRDFSVTQLLNLINLAKKTGTLIVEGPTERIIVSFREGKLAYAQAGNEPGSLSSVLHRTGKLTAAQHKVIQSRAATMSDKELGLLLIHYNYITQQDIIASLQTYFIGVVNRLFTWVEGFFRFENDLLPPDDKITVRVSLENLIIEGSRKVREWEQLQDEIPSLDMALKFTDRPGANIRNINLSVEEWRVVSYINPKNSIRQIARAAKLNDLEIRRVVYSLLQAGLVEMIRPEGAPPGPLGTPTLTPAARNAAARAKTGRPPEGETPARPEAFAAASTPGPSPAPAPTGIPGPIQPPKAESKSLIMRLINRIRSL